MHGNVQVRFGGGQREKQVKLLALCLPYWLAPHVARIARLFHDLNGMDMQVIFIDKDRVEEKNTYRQNFVPAEIGHDKAETLAMRYSLSTGCNIVALAKPFAASDCSKHIQ